MLLLLLLIVIVKEGALGLGSRGSGLERGVVVAGLLDLVEVIVITALSEKGDDIALAPVELERLGVLVVDEILRVGGKKRVREQEKAIQTIGP